MLFDLFEKKCSMRVAMVKIPFNKSYAVNNGCQESVFIVLGCHKLPFMQIEFIYGTESQEKI